MRLSLGRVLPLLLLMGACSFPEYAFDPPAGSAGSAGTAGTAGTDGGAGAPVVIPACSDRVQGVNETGIDCGGECKACVVTTPLPVCGDEHQGPKETGVDCGGDCPNCGVGEGCNTGDDCESGSCKGNLCQEPSCSDLVLNGAESDLDCGGRCPKLCGTNARCTSAADCESGICTGSRCQAPACNDKVTNGTESGPDCGGKCMLCQLGASCNTAADCDSHSCDGAQHVCVDPGCTDLTQNLSETDVDCGGASCAPCTATKHCLVNRDCESMLCDAPSKTCDAATCVDAITNQDESDVNCGGTHCPPCGIDKKCRAASDCASGVCQSKICLPAKKDTPLDQTNWVATASDTFGDSSSADLIDGMASRRWTSGKSQTPKMWIKLDMSKPQYFFTITLDAKEWPGDAGTAYNIYYSMDTNFSSTPSRTFSSSKAVQVISSDTVILARSIKIELTAPGTEWWSVGEMSVTQ